MVARGDVEAVYSTATAAARDRRAAPRRRPVAMVVQEQGRALVTARAGREGLRPAGRDDGGGRRGRAVADRDRADVLQHDRRLPGGARAAARARVDRRRCRVVRAPARDGRVHRRCLVHRAEILELRGDWDVALEEAGGRASASSAARTAGAAARPIPPGRGPPRARGARRRRAGLPRCEPLRPFEPQPGLALLRLAQGRDDAAAGARPPAPPRPPTAVERLRLLPAASRSCSRSATSTRRAAASEELERSPSATTAAWRGRRGRARRRGGRARRAATRGAALGAAAVPSHVRRNWTCRTRRRGRSVLVALACRRARRRGRRRRSSSRRARHFRAARRGAGREPRGRSRPRRGARRHRTG